MHTAEGTAYSARRNRNGFGYGRGDERRRGNKLKTAVPVTDRLLEEVAYSTNLMPNSYKKMTHGEIYEILMESK